MLVKEAIACLLQLRSSQFGVHLPILRDTFVVHLQQINVEI